jgi:acyl-CoA thioesterase I
MKAKQSASTFGGHMVRLMAIVNLWLAASLGAAFAADDGAPVRIVALGDSLTAGYMLKPAEAFPVQLQDALKAKGIEAEVANAGVSGDTTAAGLERFEWAVPEGTEAVILELGANDALRGIDPDETRKNLDQILTKLQERKIAVLLAGMDAPKNWGPDYEKRFSKIYTDLAEKHGAILYPFFLEGVALDPKLNLEDGMHPTGAGIGVIVTGILPQVEELITRVRGQRTAASKT